MLVQRQFVEPVGFVVVDVVQNVGEVSLRVTAVEFRGLTQ